MPFVIPHFNFSLYSQDPFLWDRDANRLLYGRGDAKTTVALRSPEHQTGLPGLPLLQPSHSQRHKGRDEAIRVGKSLGIRKAAAGKQQSLQTPQICPSAPLRWKQIKTETTEVKVSVLPLISTQGWGSGLVLPFLCRLLPLSLESGVAVACCLWSSALNVKRSYNCVSKCTYRK